MRDKMIRALALKREAEHNHSLAVRQTAKELLPVTWEKVSPYYTVFPHNSPEQREWLEVGDHRKMVDHYEQMIDRLLEDPRAEVIEWYLSEYGPIDTETMEGAILFGVLKA